MSNLLAWFATFHFLLRFVVGGVFLTVFSYLGLVSVFTVGGPEKLSVGFKIIIAVISLVVSFSLSLVLIALRPF